VRSGLRQPTQDRQNSAGISVRMFLDRAHRIGAGESIDRTASPRSLLPVHRSETERRRQQSSRRWLRAFGQYVGVPAIGALNGVRISVPRRRHPGMRCRRRRSPPSLGDAVHLRTRGRFVPIPNKPPRPAPAPPRFSLFSHVFSSFASIGDRWRACCVPCITETSDKSGQKPAE